MAMNSNYDDNGDSKYVHKLNIFGVHIYFKHMKQTKKLNDFHLW